MILPLCPKCKRQLIKTENSAKCDSGHCFDFAKEGYLNLLLGSSAAVHGDNREMLLARRAFLDEGHYAPLCDAVARAVSDRTPGGGAVLDIGCGEGYYTAAMTAALGDGANVFALDVSKDAVRLAARRCRTALCTVASAYELPYANASFDTVSNLFSSLCLDEIRRVLRVGGYFVMAIPEQDHLFEMKCVLYDEPYKNEPKDTFLEGFSLVQDQRIRYSMHLGSGSEILSLLSMTPYAYRTPRAGLERLRALDKMEVSADFRLLVYRFDGGAPTDRM